MEIRDAIEADISKVTDIFNQTIPGGDAEWTEELHTVEERVGWWRERLAAGRPVLVAVDQSRDDPVIGVASYGDFRESACRGGFRLVVEHSVYLDENAKGLGAADGLMDVLCDRAREAGLRWMVATIDAANDRSLAFHARRGFFEVGRMPDIGYTFDTWRTLVLMQFDLHTGSIPAE